eukprot:2997799-Pyramimonas_sp.AAC.1
MGSGFGNMALTSAMWLFGVSALIVLFVMPSEEKSQAMGRLLSEKDRQFTHQVYFDISELSLIHISEPTRPEPI